MSSNPFTDHKTQQIFDSDSNSHSHSQKRKALPFYLYASLSILWLYSGIIPVLFAKSESLNMLAQLGIPQPLQMAVFVGASLLDVIFGLLILSRYRFNSVLWLAQLSVVIGYSLIIAIGIPEIWVHPFGPLIKNVPIMALLLFMVHIHSLDATQGAKQDAINCNN